MEMITNLIVGKVLECEQHPNADKLKVTKVDIGTEVLQIVCGAPNVSVNQKVIVATIGTKFPAFEIKKAKLRGIESFGMLCGEEEIGLKQTVDGLLILSDSFKVGESFWEQYTSDLKF